MNHFVKRSIITLIITFVSIISATAVPHIIPLPHSVKSIDGEPFLLDANVKVLFKDKRACNSYSFINDYLKRYYGFSLGKCGGRYGGKIVELIIEDNLDKKIGSYSLYSCNNKITIKGYNEQGLFYGIQTLIQLLPVNGQENILIPALEIDDEPKFEYRGMHLDVVRHIFPLDFIKRYIDYLALHKMNYFHWHLTDDQGWRMESKSHPKLNEKGAYRDATIIGIFPGTGIDSTRYGGYYKIEELKEIVDYAAKRYITVVPEIDIPGHCMAVLAAYPEFGTEPNREVKPAITWGIFNRENNVLAPSEEVFSFLEDVFNELMDIFPSEYIHIGADECAHKWWSESSKVQQFIKENNLGDEKGLQRYFAERVTAIIKARGRTPIAWDELVDYGYLEDVVIMSWRGNRNFYKGAEMGNKTILTPSPYSYLNCMQRADESRLAHRSRVVDVEKVYSFKPIADTLSTNVANKILGGQGCMWTEYYANESEVEYAIFPRLSAISEVYWSNDEYREWSDFYNRLQIQFNRYKLWGADYCTYVLDSNSKK